MDDLIIKNETERWICKICNGQFHKNGIKNHIRGHLKLVKGIKGRKVWNTGLTKANDQRLIKSAKTYTTKFNEGKIKHNKGIKISEETRLKLKQNAGGIREGSGFGKKGWYKEFRCDSTWELAFVIYCLDHNIKIVRNKQSFEYIFENNKHKYYPDFILEDGSYVEIKGYLRDNDKEKIKQFPHYLIVIMKSKIKKYLNYIKEKYNKNENEIVELYDKRKK